MKSNKEVFKPSPQNKEKEKSPKSTLFYKPFEKEKHKKSGVFIDAHEEEEEIQLKELEAKLNTKEKDEKLIQRLKQITGKLQPKKLWIKTTVAGEVHYVEFMSLQEQEKIIQTQDLSKLMGKGSDFLNVVEVNFRLKKTEGRAEPLFLLLRTPLTTLLKGGGSLEKQLANLIKGQFAGTGDHYKKLQQQERELLQKSEETPEFQSARARIKGELQKRGAEILEAEGENLFSIIANFPDQKRQIHISTINKEDWNVLEQTNQKQKEEFNLKPQEIITAYIEQQ